jgi:hypothetical protein
MKLVNETQQKLAYWIQYAGGSPDCGHIDVNGLVDLPQYDDQTDVYVAFKPTDGQKAITINCANTGKGEQVELALVAG